MSAELFGAGLLQEVHEEPLSAVSPHLRPFLIGKHMASLGAWRSSHVFNRHVLTVHGTDIQYAFPEGRTNVLFSLCCMKSFEW